MTVQDAHGTELLEFAQLPERDLARLQPLTHAVVVARHADRTLLVFNRFKQHWELPGGRIDAGEAPRACAVRELDEESAVTCSAGDLQCAGALKIRVRAAEDSGAGDFEDGELIMRRAL